MIVVLTTLAVSLLLDLEQYDYYTSEQSRQGFREPAKGFLAIVPSVVMRLVVLFASGSFSAGKLKGEER